MIKVLIFLIKILITVIAIPMWWLNIVIVVIMWEGKFMVVNKLIDLIWDKPKDKLKNE